jgi:hypothetical protein
LNIHKAELRAIEEFPVSPFEYLIKIGKEFHNFDNLFIKNKKWYEQFWLKNEKLT